MFVHVTDDNGGNVLSIDSLKQMDADLVLSNRMNASSCPLWFHGRPHPG